MTAQAYRLFPSSCSTSFCVWGRAGEKWDKQHGVGVERAELVARTRDAVTKGLAAGHLWHVATHAEHARPMLQARKPFRPTCLLSSKPKKTWHCARPWVICVCISSALQSSSCCSSRSCNSALHFSRNSAARNNERLRAQSAAWA